MHKATTAFTESHSRLYQCQIKTYGGPSKPW